MMLGATPAFGLTVTSVSGASAYNLTSAVTVTGGVAGADCSASAPNWGSTCDSCAREHLICPTSPLCACNTKRIYDSLILTLNLQSEQPGANAIVFDPVRRVSIPLVSSGNKGQFVSLRWAELCFAMSGMSCAQIHHMDGALALQVVLDRDNNGTLTSGEESVDFTVKISAPDSSTFSVFGMVSNEGIRHFLPLGGNRRVYLEDVEATQAFPWMSYGSKIKGVRVFMSDTNMNHAAPGLGLEPVDLPLTESGDRLALNVIDGLEGGKPYAFRLGLLDEANNVVQFIPSFMTESCDLSPLDPATCSFATTPFAR